MSLPHLKSFEVWFVTGSQHLYGPETLEKVAEHAEKITNAFNTSKKIPVKIVYTPIVKTPEEIFNLCQQANTSLNCIGLICWMHTFSPAKMWINGLKIIQKQSRQVFPVL
jgi:L-arabinose isomerase